MNVGVSVEGLDKLRAMVAQMQQNAANLSPATLRAGVAVLRAAQKRIEAGGPGWQPNVSGTPLLRQPDGGTLFRSLSLGASGNIADAQANTIRVGTNVYYAEWNQDGTGVYRGGDRIVPKNKKALAFRLGGKNVVVKSIKGSPARPFLLVDDQLAKTVGDIFARFILSDGTVS